MSWLNGPDRRTQALQTAARYIEKLEAALTAAQAQVGILSAQLAAETSRRQRAERRSRELEAESARIPEARRPEKRLKQRIAELEDELRKATVDPNLTRQHVLRQQALRARLAKTDMRPAARLRTLQAAEAAGMELSPEQLDELEDLEFEAASQMDCR